ncbi:ParB/RepB/Spo0J family partition protein [Bradyrhizobium sp. USDA 4341]
MRLHVWPLLQQPGAYVCPPHLQDALLCGCRRKGPKGFALARCKPLPPRTQENCRQAKGVNFLAFWFPAKGLSACYPNLADGQGRRRGVRPAPMEAKGRMIMSAKSVEIISASGTEIFIPLNKLKKSPNNARKMPHSETAIEALAASIAAKGILQNLVVEPEVDGEGAATGFFCVTIGEGRRLAQLLRVKRKEIKKTEPIRCIVDTANDPHEISLDENVTRENMHPADQFEAFRRLAEERGFGAEEIAARFGATPHVVKQRLRLAAVSPRLIQLYRDGDLALEQVMAFAITDDQARQESVYERLSYDRDAGTIRRLLTETHVPATDRRARFVGLEAYTEAGGTILRDLFTEDRGGYLEDVALLDLLVTARLGREADNVRAAEGWKWTAPSRLPARSRHAAGLLASGRAFGGG